MFPKITTNFMAATLLLLPFTANAEVVDKVVAVVNNEAITQYELQNFLQSHGEDLKKMQEAMKKGSPAKAPEGGDTGKNLALKKLIDDKLLDQEMGKRQIAVNDGDVDKSIAGILERNKITEAQLAQELKAKGVTMPQYREELKQQLKKMKLMGQMIAPKVKVTDADLDDFFAKNPEKFGNFQSVDIAQIIIPLAPEADSSAFEQAKKTAEAVAAQARRGADFAELGKKFSASPQTALRNIYQTNQLAPQIAAILADLKPNTVSEPVRSPMGIHIIKLFERKTLAGEEYRAIREQIRERVFEMKLEEELNDYLDQLKAKSSVQIKA